MINEDFWQNKEHQAKENVIFWKMLCFDRFEFVKRELWNWLLLISENTNFWKPVELKRN